MLISSFLSSTCGPSSEQRHFNIQAKAQDSLRGRTLCMIIITKAMNSKSKKLFQHRVRIGFSLQQDDNNIYHLGLLQGLGDLIFVKCLQCYHKNIVSDYYFSHRLNKSPPLECVGFFFLTPPWSTWHVGSVTRVYVPRFFVSSQQRFGVTDIKAPWPVTAPRSWCSPFQTFFFFFFCV